MSEIEITGVFENVLGMILCKNADTDVVEYSLSK